MPIRRRANRQRAARTGRGAATDPRSRDRPGVPGAASLERGTHRPIRRPRSCCNELGRQVLLAWLVVTVALRLRALGQGGWAVVIFVVGLIAVALGTVADAMSGALVRSAQDGNDR